MKKQIIPVLAIIVVILLSGFALAQTEKVYVLQIDGTIELGLATYVQRGLELAAQDNAAILLEINTLGGRVDAALEIRDQILQMKTPVIAYVKERAISAGALITIASPHVAVAPGATLGAAEPRPSDEKTISFLRAEFESTAEKNGRDQKVAGAMVDSSLAIDGLVSSGKLLTLTANQAYEYEYADAILSSRKAVLDHFDLGSADVIEIERNWAERLAGFVTDPTVSQILLVLGFVGLLVELITPGFGVPGLIGVTSIGLFFGGRIIAGLAGYEVIILFVLGIVLLIVEVFVVPGFGAPGALGILSIFTSIYFSYDNPYVAITNIIVAIVATILLIALLWKRLRKTPFFGRFIHVASEKKELGYSGVSINRDLLNKSGVSVTNLRPSGIALIEDQRYDVITDGEFIPRDSKVIVNSIEGNRIVVKKDTNENS